MRAFPREHPYVTAHLILKQQWTKLVADEASQRLFAWKRLELLRIQSRVLRQCLEGDLENLEVQAILAFEMIVDGRLIDPSLGDDVAHARALEPLFREQRNRGFYDQVAGIFCGARHCSL